MIPINYKEGDVVPTNGRWICSCGIGHYAHESKCANRGCGKDRQGEEGVQVWGSAKVLPNRPVTEFHRIMNRSLFRHGMVTGKLMVA